MILLFNCGGRTGNQLFQLSHAISSRKKSEWLISFGFGETRSLLIGEWKKKWLNIDNRLIRAIAETYLYPVLYHGLVKTGLVSSHFEWNARCIPRIGKIRRITIMKGYFESSSHLAVNLTQSFRLKESLRAKARPVLDALPHGSLPVFVHVRRSDFGALSIMLPERYYLNAILVFLKKHPHAFFVIVGDDPAYAEMIFKNIDSKLTPRGTPFEDLAIMSLCAGGVLSNSTFAWWGAFFGRGSLGYVAPKYWSGWNRKEWTPPEILADFMTDVIDV